MFSISAHSARNTKAPDKPNEDFYIVRNNAVVVCDGISRSRRVGVYPVPSPASTVSEVFARTAMGYLDSVPTSPATFMDSFLTGNAAVGVFNQRNFPQPDYAHTDLAGTVAVVGVSYNGLFYYAYIGDCAVYVWYDGRLQRHTALQTANVEPWLDAHGRTLTAYTEVRREARNHIGHPLAYGAITGEDSAIDFIERGHFPLRSDMHILLVTDGLIDYLDTEQPAPPYDAKELCKEAGKTNRDDRTAVCLGVEM